jgi:photosystem II stability/assembly factor-like uncharacterized protein
MEDGMKRNIVTGTLVVIFTCFLISANIVAQDFTRSLEIPVPETNLNNGGTGNMISGVDLDGDGLLEIYLVNDNWNDTPSELIPRIYKLEQPAADNYIDWPVVWKAVPPIPKQNTWPGMLLCDLDKDGKQEIMWGPVNFTGTDNPNPPRILVYESAGDGSDVMGVSDGAGNYLPNASWTITTEDNANIRPTRFVIADPDEDGVEEIIFSDRGGNTSGYYFGVASVSDIPDAGDGSETWTLEISGKDFGDLAAAPIENKWDVAVLGSNIYTFCEVEISKLSWDGASWNYTALTPLLGGISFISSQVVDLDNDGTQEIICGEYYFGQPITRVLLLQEDADTLKHTELARVGDSERLFGSACGDIDQDGYLDFVFGTRAGDPDGAVYRLAYRGGDITNPASYELTTIDSLYAAGSYTNVINITNLDGDPELEVLYTSSVPAGTFPNLGTQPIVVLDYVGPKPITFDNLVIASEVLLNGETPTGLMFKPGRILDNGNTIWFCGVDGTNKLTYVFRSNDGGATFTHNATAIPGRAAQVDAFDANTALVGTAEGKIYKTDDGGANWTEKYSYMISVIAPGWFDGLRVLNENVAVAFGDMEPNGNMRFVRTEDKGDTWTEIAGIDYLNAAYGYYTWGLAMCNVGESIWCAATTMEYDSSFVFRSYDAGVTWESFRIPNDVIATYPRSIAFTDNYNGMIADRRGNVVKSTDGGATWTVTHKPDTASSCFVNGVVAIPNTSIIVALDDIGVYYTPDLGATCGKMNTPEATKDDNFVSAVFLNKDFGYIFSYGGKVLRFENQVTGIAERPSEHKPTDFVLEQNYPNPFNPTTTIAFSVPQTQKVTLKVYNLMGEEIKTLVEGNVSAGNHYVNWDATDNSGQKVTSGLYLYTLKIGNQKLTKSMIFLK